MTILGINHVLNWVQISNGWGTYTCPTFEKNGELYFEFKKEIHRVKDYTSEYTHEFKE